MKRYDIQAVDWTESVGLEIAEYELGEWCKAEDAITELAAKDARIAELEAEVKFLRGWIGGELVVFGSEIDDKFAEWKQKQNAI